MKQIKTKWHLSIKEIPEIIWNNLLGINGSPFYKWEWLHALEISESVQPPPRKSGSIYKC